MRADGAGAAAAVAQEPQAEVGTQLRVLLEQQLWELAPAPRGNRRGEPPWAGPDGAPWGLGSSSGLLPPLGKTSRRWRLSRLRPLRVAPGDRRCHADPQFPCKLWLRSVSGQQQVLRDWAATVISGVAGRYTHLGHQSPLCGQAVLQEEGTLGAAQAV